MNDTTDPVKSTTPETAKDSAGSLERMVGPCADAEQRIKDLYIVNTVAGWAQNNLRVLAEMSAHHKLPEWYVKEVIRIGREMETVASREAARRPNSVIGTNSPTKDKPTTTP